MGVQKLNRAKARKNDEFYTRLSDVVAGVGPYAQALEGRIVYCNCDSAFESAFAKFFILAFKALRLKALILSCYGAAPLARGRQPSLFDPEPQAAAYCKPYAARITSVPDDLSLLFEEPGNRLWLTEGDGAHGAGDFRSRECLELLDEADVVVTNPPFSLMREFIPAIRNKDFLIVAPVTALSLNAVVPALCAGRLEARSPRLQFFAQPSGLPATAVTTCCWLTTLKKPSPELSLPACYSAERYPAYDGGEAIECPKTALIPGDYFGPIGVPVTAAIDLPRTQFELLGAIGPSLQGKALFRRFVIRRIDAPKKKGAQK